MLLFEKYYSPSFIFFLLSFFPDRMQQQKWPLLAFSGLARSPKIQLTKTSSQQLQCEECPFQSPLFHKLPVTEHPSSTTQKRQPCTALPPKVDCPCSDPWVQGWALGEPGVCVLGSGGGWCDSIAPNKAPIAGIKEQGSLPSPHLEQSILNIWNRASCTQREAAREAVWDRHSTVSKRSLRWIQVCCSNPHPLPGHWVCTKISDMKGSRASQKLLVHSG